MGVQYVENIGSLTNRVLHFPESVSMKAFTRWECLCLGIIRTHHDRGEVHLMKQA